MMTGKEFYRQMSDYANSLTHNNEEVTEEFINDHRALQEEVLCICYDLIKTAAVLYDEGNYDLRNAWSFKVAADIVKKEKQI